MASPDERPPKILVVDDVPQNVRLLEAVLVPRGYQVLTANDGISALELVEAEQPDLILLDVMMPRLSGYDVCQKVRENPAWAGVRIIMLSAKGRDVEVNKGMAVGADAYVTKPFSTKDLMATVREMLGA